jgi:NAD-dependent SIR2 family protein deacetylase
MFEHIDTQEFWENTPIKQEMIETVELRKLRKLLRVNNDRILIFAGAGMSQESNLPLFSSRVQAHENTLKSLHPKDSNFNSRVLAHENTKVNTFNNLEHKTQKDVIDLFDSHTPHIGYTTLLRILRNKDYYIFTSNIDGYFLKAGFDCDRIIEIHGNVHYTQCPNGCPKIKPYEEDDTCEDCKVKMVPNVFTGGFHNFINKTSDIEKKMDDDINNYPGPQGYIIIEIGAGINIPVIRDYSEILVEDKGLRLVRINPEYWQIPVDILSINTARLPHSATIGIKVIENLLL